MRNKLRRPLAFLLSAVMIVTMSGTPVHAVADRGQPETGLCEHHAAHTDDCGYTEETPGTPCGHEHTEDCYTEVTECVHEHTPECYPEETEDSVSDNEATPANAEEREPENCPHICDKESGCITEKLDCRHEHDSECGYTESTPGTPCTYVCEICNPQDSGEADEEPETGIIKQEQCSCLTLCTEGQINPDCPVCGAENAGLSDCKGKAEKEDTKQPEDTGICKHHQEHDDACGYQPESEDSEGSPCTYECRICPIEDLIAALPDKVTEDNAEDVRAQLDKILALFGELTEDEQEQLDLSRVYELQGALDNANAPIPLVNGDVTLTTGNKEVIFTVGECGDNCQGHTITQNVQGGVVEAAKILVESGTHDITFSGLNLSSAVVGIMPGGTMNLTLDGNNTITANSNLAGIYVPVGATLVITEESTGSLTVSGSDSAGIGGAWYAPTGKTGNFDCGTVVINGGTIAATGSGVCAGIGGAYDDDNQTGGNGGTVTINGGTVTATGGVSNVFGGAGIGGGGATTSSKDFGCGGTLTINGGHVTLTAPCSNAYGFGKGYGRNPSGTCSLTLADESYLTLTDGTKLDPNGTYTINGDPTEDMIVVLEGLIYTGQTLDVSDIKIDDSKTGTATYFGQTFRVQASADGWVLQDLGEVKESGTYTAVFKKGDKTISKTFTVKQSGTDLTSEGKVLTYNGDTQTTTFTVDDTITVKATPTATGQAPANSAMFAASFTGPGAGQMAVFVGDTQVSAPADKGADGTYTMTVSAADVLTNGQAGQDNKYTLIARFVENTNMANAEAQVEVTVTPNPLTEGMVTLSAESATYDGTEQQPNITVAGLTAGTDYDVTFQAGFKNAGTYTVTITGKGIYAGTVEKTYTIKKATPTIAWENDEMELTYTGQPADIEPTVTLVNSETFSGTITYTYGVYSGPDRPTDAASYTVKASIPEQDNYTAAESGWLILYINPAQGQLTVPETQISRKFGDAAFSLNCSTNGDGKISYASSDESVVSVSADGMALIKGTGTAVVTVSLAEGVNYTGGTEATVTVMVGKADAPPAGQEIRNYTYINGSNGAVAIDVAGKFPSDRGGTKYTFAAEDDKHILSGVSMDGNGNLTFTVPGNKSEGDTASITVTAEMANYENATYTVEIVLVAKKTVEPQAGSSVTINGSNILTYGQMLSDLTLDSVIFVEQGTDKEVKGSLTWKNPDAAPAAADRTAEWVFTPEDTGEYMELAGTVNITVAKATPEVEAPRADAAVYHPSNTLGSVGLAGGSATWTVSGSAVTVEGTWGWKDPLAIPEAGNRSYTAVFTPEGKDAANYNTVECTVAVAVEKAVPHIAAPPKAAQITYGNALDTSALTGGAAQYSGGDGTVVPGSFVWKDGSIKPAVPDSGSTRYAVVFIPADGINYSSVETVVTLVIGQAENAPGMPPESMKVARRYEKAGSVPLPEGWQWQETDRDTALEIGVPVTATAVYNGEDRENYKNVSVAVAITRSECDHKNTELRNAAAATCQKKGYSGDTYCLDCGELLAKGAETDLADHSGGTATCVSGRVCTVCGTEYGAKDSTSHAHKEIRGQRDAACTADGYTGDEFCTDCGAKTGSGAVIAATGHDWHVTREEPATTSSEGKRYYACSKCRLTREETIPKLPQPSHTHSYSAGETKAATCTENGVITYSCSCGDSYTQNTAALGHDYRSRVTKEPTRTEAGVRTYTCTRCQGTYTESIPKLPEEAHTHSYKGRVTKKASCTETGIRTYTCACGDRYTKSIPALGHSYKHKVTKKPTTEKTGVRTYTCTRCGNAYTEEIPKLPAKDHKHDYSDTVVKEASCTEAGVRRFLCACGDAYTENIPAYGHSYHSRVTQEPTVSAEGVMTYTCSRCGDTYTRPVDRLKDTPSKPEGCPESGIPFIKDEPGRDGWETIKEETDRAEDGSTVTVDMNGSAIVPGGVLENIRGRDVTIVFDMGDGITWSVDGMSVKDGDVGDTDFSVRTGTEEIPEDKADSIAGEKYSIQMSLAHEGEFGFTAVLSLDLGRENAGLYARLFYYNESTGELETAARAEKIAGDGRVSLAFTHASEYVIVVDTGEGNPPEEGAEDVSSGAPADSAGTDAGDKSMLTGQPWKPWWIVIIGALVVIIGIGAFFVARKKKEDGDSC